MAPHRFPSAFTLVELMVATAILTVILLLVFNITQQTADAWKSSAAKIESFQGARAGFECLTRTISQATLHTYYDYFSATGERKTNANAETFVPHKYGRYSDLHFVAGKSILQTQITHSIFFQAPTAYTEDQLYKGMESPLNGTGFYVEYNVDSFRPSFLDTIASRPPARKRYRLMQFTQPTEKLAVYKPFTEKTALNWITDDFSSGSTPPVYPLADNIVALIIHPRRSDEDALALGSKGELSPEYEYDSRTFETWGPNGKQPVTQNQLPPLVDVVMIAVDEPSFSRLGNPPSAPDLGQHDLFQEIDSPDKLEADLQTMEDVLNAKSGNKTGNSHNLRYRIFRSEVPIRAAKWSE